MDCARGRRRPASGPARRSRAAPWGRLRRRSRRKVVDPAFRQKRSPRRRGPRFLVPVASPCGLAGRGCSADWVGACVGACVPLLLASGCACPPLRRRTSLPLKDVASGACRDLLALHVRLHLCLVFFFCFVFCPFWCFFVLCFFSPVISLHVSFWCSLYSGP